MKKQKICITGCLGYIGSNLVELLSGEARYKDIVCLDNRFISARVSQLRDWGMQFYQGSILDKDFLQKHLHEADVVYHLAGITDVAYVATQANKEHDELIRSVGIDGTRKVLHAIPSTCKLIFPSTHVVFEGLQETTFDIAEDATTCPVLTYAQGKVQSEEDLSLWAHAIDSKGYPRFDNFVIVRLGSVYGYSGDTMRVGIMPNLFSKITSQDGTISLFGGGVQYKSLVNVIDVVRAMKFLADGPYIGTFHLSNENMTVREVALICKDINPKVTLLETADEIPNKGYTLSNAKLLATGFKFLYNIKDSIQDMVSRWSVKLMPQALEYIDKGGNEYIDNRGIIRNYELTEPINLIGWIESKTGTIRANHYHPIQEQKCLLISGRYVSVTQDLAYPDAPVEYKVINPGGIAIIRPNVAHTMVFLQDSMFLNLVRGERDHDNYGITHTIPYKLVDEEHRKSILHTYSLYKTCCRVCGDTNLIRSVVSLGQSPLANNLLDTADQPYDTYPLEWDYCPHCYNIQLSVVVPPGKMFDNYLYVSSTSQVFRQHFEEAADRYIREFNLTADSIVWDIGSNDGIFLKPLKDRGIQVCGIEPAGNLATLANNNGIPTVQGYFNQDVAHEAYIRSGSPSLITASNVFAHADDLADIANTVFANLTPGGVFIIEVQYLMDTLRDMTFDNIYHEHVNYWSVTALRNFFNRLGYTLFHVEHIDTHGGSIRCFISKDHRDINTSVLDFLHQELISGINKVSTFRDFNNKLTVARTNVRKNLDVLRQKFPKVCGYGSPAKATTALNYFGITSGDIEYTIDDNLLKQGKIIPGVGTRIIQIATGFDMVIVLAWNFFDSIKAKLSIPCISIKDLEKDWHDLPLLDTKTTELQGTKVIGKIYDCFLFFNELDLLELRMNILDHVVDYFVICEANITHSGVAREYCFAANRSRFTKWADKIIYIQVDDIPDDFTNLPDSIIAKALQDNPMVQLSESIMCREQWQRASIIRGLEHAQTDDIIILSDIDEIPNPDTVQGILANFDSNRLYGLRQNSYYYYINLLKERHWVGPRIASYQKFCTYTPVSFRHIRDIIIADGGWHFSFQGDYHQVQTKLLAYSHSDMATVDVLEHLSERIEQGIDPFNRGKLEKVQVDSTYPQYILDNMEQYNHMIL